MSARLDMRRCQRRLLALWGGWSVIGLGVVLVQTSPGGAYEANGGAVWDWFLPTVIPTLSLMLGTVLADARQPADDADPPSTVDAVAYRVALWTSVLYLVLVLALLLMYAQAPAPVDALRERSRLVSTIYSVVGIALGTFFVSKRRE
jgi:hypothetical protein